METEKKKKIFFKSSRQVEMLTERTKDSADGGLRGEWGAQASVPALGLVSCTTRSVSRFTSLRSASSATESRDGTTSFETAGSIRIPLSLKIL